MVNSENESKSNITLSYSNNNKSKDVAIINPNNAKVLNNYIEHDMINENGIYESTNTIPMARYQYVVNVPQEYSAQTKNISLTTNGSYNVSDYLDIGYNALKANSTIGVNVSQLYNPETVAIGPLLRNGTYNINNYISSGYNAVKDDSTIEVRVDPEIVIDGMRKRDYGTTITSMTNFVYASSNTQRQVARDETLVVITVNESNKNIYKISQYSNTTTSSYSVSVYRGEYYYTFSDFTDIVYYVSDNSNVFGIFDSPANDTKGTYVTLSMDYYSIIFN